jgi:hypothetical protein
MYKLLMTYKGNPSELPDIYTLDTEMLGPYVLIYDVLQGYISELPDIHSPDIGISGPYVQIYDE